MSHVYGVEIYPQSNGTFLEADGAEFDVAVYSNMKHGDREAACQLGGLLGKALINELPSDVLEHKAVFTVPACVYAPKPALAVANVALTLVNIHRAQNNVEPAKMMRMYTDAMGSSAYAQSSLEERTSARAKWTRQYHIPTSLVQDAHVFALDDCIITGSTEASQVERISEHSPARIICGYAVKVDPVTAAQFPGIEDVLNMASNPSLETVSELVRKGEFLLNSRVLGLILRTEDHDKLAVFFDECPTHVIRDMHEAVINSTLEYQVRYPETIALLTRKVASR